MTYAPAPQAARPPRTGWGPVALKVVAVLALYAVVGAGCGWLWFTLWDPPVGVAFEGEWFLDEAGLRAQFPGTGWFVLVALAAGVVLGVLCAVALGRSELATLAAVVVGSCLATYVMWRVGLHLGPDDPDVLARTATDRERLPGRLEVAGVSPFLALPLASLAALALTYAAFPGRADRQGLSGNHRG